MKVIVTGATGFVGKQVVSQCIDNPEISSILVLTRRNIDQNLSQSSKVRVILHHDFHNYPQELLKQLRGSHSCIW
jgi:nucleoside-diphosphate-sugar epimerase